MSEIYYFMKSRILPAVAVFVAGLSAWGCGGGATNTANNDANASPRANVVANSTMLMNANGVTVEIVPDKPGSSGSKPVNLATGNMKNASPTPDQKPPKGANYLCRDGTYSTGTQDSTACSGHNGVSRPLSDKPPQ